MYTFMILYDKYKLMGNPTDFDGTMARYTHLQEVSINPVLTMSVGLRALLSLMTMLLQKWSVPIRLLRMSKIKEKHVNKHKNMGHLPGNINKQNHQELQNITIFL